MTGNKCLLDTSAIIHSFRKANDVAAKLNAMAEIYVQVTAIGELYFGAYKSDNIPKHLSIVQSFLINCKILATDRATAEVYGTIRAALAKKGRPLPENDIWIAASALQYNLPLFTLDNHFKEINGLILL